MARYSPHAAQAPLSERVLLSLYDWRDPDERAAIKRCGAKWDPVLRAWWIKLGCCREPRHPPLGD